MSAPFSLHIPLRVSPVLWGCLVALHLAPVLSVAAPEVAWLPALLVWLASAGSFVWQLKCAYDRKIQVLTLLPELGVWRTPVADVEIDLQPDSFESAWLIVLHWRARDSGRHARAALLRDALSADDWRRLRAHLRLLAPAHQA